MKFRSDVDVELLSHNASDLDVARAAWVSTAGEDSKEKDGDRVPGLINFLMRDRHGSPFEHSTFRFFIKCPIFVVREFHRHRAGWSYNEESGRYSVLKPEFYVPNEERNMVQTGKPGHYKFVPADKNTQLSAIGFIQRSTLNSWNEYQELLNAGVAKEVARMVLPLNIYTSFYASCNARSLMHFLGLRTENEDALFVSRPQHEIQLVANKMEEHFKAVMPLTHDAWNKNRRVAP